MKPIDSHYSNCDVELSYLFQPFIDKLEGEFRDEYFTNSLYMYASGLRINGLTFYGQHSAKVLAANGIESKVMVIPVDYPKAKYFFDNHTEIIYLWEKLSKYRKMMLFHDMEHMFLKLTDLKDPINLPSQNLQWALKVEEEFNVFKARKLLEGF